MGLSSLHLQEHLLHGDLFQKEQLISINLHRVRFQVECKPTNRNPCHCCTRCVPWTQNRSRYPRLSREVISKDSFDTLARDIKLTSRMSLQTNNSRSELPISTTIPFAEEAVPNKLPNSCKRRLPGDVLATSLQKPLPDGIIRRNQRFPSAGDIFLREHIPGS